MIWEMPKHQLPNFKLNICQFIINPSHCLVGWSFGNIIKQFQPQVIDVFAQKQALMGIDILAVAKILTETKVSYRPVGGNSGN